MREVRLGETGLKLSALGLGMWSYGDPSLAAWVLDEEQARPLVRAAVEGGIRFFDTADGYWNGASETITGRLLAELLPREDYVLGTKVWMPTREGMNGRGLGRKHLMDAIDRSLERLGTDYVDLYTIHRADPDTPIEETMEALNDIVRAGKARFIGASSMRAWEFAKAQNVAERRGWSRFVAMQNHYNLLAREDEREMIPMCRDMGVGCTPWSPLARGVLAGSISRDGSQHTTRAQTESAAQRFYGSEADFAIIDRVAAIADARGVSAAQVALAWVMGAPGVSAPIFGATKPHHVEQALAASELELTPEERAELEAPYEPRAPVELE